MAPDKLLGAAEAPCPCSSLSKRFNQRSSSFAKVTDDRLPLHRLLLGNLAGAVRIQGTAFATNRLRNATYLALPAPRRRLPLAARAEKPSPTMFLEELNSGCQKVGKNFGPHSPGSYSCGNLASLTHWWSKNLLLEGFGWRKSNPQASKFSLSNSIIFNV